MYFEVKQKKCVEETRTH